MIKIGTVPRPPIDAAFDFQAFQVWDGPRQGVEEHYTVRLTTLGHEDLIKWIRTLYLRSVILGIGRAL